MLDLEVGRLAVDVAGTTRAGRRPSRIIGPRCGPLFGVRKMTPDRSGSEVTLTTGGRSPGAEMKCWVGIDCEPEALATVAGGVGTLGVV